MMKNLARAALLTVLAACAEGNTDQPLPSSDAPEAWAEAPRPQPAEQQVEKLPALSPHGGPPGTKVTVTMNNLPLGDTVEVGFGSGLRSSRLVMLMPPRPIARPHGPEPTLISGSRSVRRPSASLPPG